MAAPTLLQLLLETLFGSTLLSDALKQLHALANSLSPWLIILSCPIACSRYFGSPDLVRAGTLLSLKMISVLCMISVEMFSYIFARTSSTLTDTCYDCLQVNVCYNICLGILLYVEHKYSVRTNMPMSLFLFLSFLNDTTRAFPSGFDTNDYQTRAYYIASAVFTFGLFLLNEVPKLNSIREETLRSQHSWASTSGVLGRVFIPCISQICEFGFFEDPAAYQAAVVDKVSSDELFKKFQPYWESTSRDGKSNLLARALYRTLHNEFWDLGISRLYYVLLTITQPLLVSSMIVSIDEARLDGGSYVAVCKVFAAAVAIYAGIFVLRASYKRAEDKVTVLARGTIGTAVYQKSTRLGHKDAQRQEGATLLSRDVEAAARALPQVHEVWAAPLEFLSHLFLLYLMLGKASFLIGLPTILSSVIGRLLSKNLPNGRKLWMKSTEIRTSTTSSMLMQIAQIRKVGLDPAYYRTLQKLHRNEVKNSSSARLWNILAMVTAAFCNLISGPLLVTGSLFWTTMTDGLVPANAFAISSTAILIGDLLQRCLGLLARIRTPQEHLDRIQRYLTLQESGLSDNDLRPPAECSSEDNDHGVAEQETHCLSTPIRFENATILMHNPAKTLLKHITVSVEEGETLLVTGKSVCTKSGFLQYLIGEGKLEKGSTYVQPGPVGYCSRNPWLYNTSLRDNIIGCSLLDNEWYTTVLQACELHHDVEFLKGGDRTVVGINGSQLSKGQRLQVCIARAVYSRSSIIVFDDVFAEMDRALAYKIFSNLFGEDGLLSQGPTSNVVATNRVDFLQLADRALDIGADGTANARHYATDRAFREQMEILDSQNSESESATPTEETGTSGDIRGKSISSSQGAENSYSSWDLLVFYLESFSRRQMLCATALLFCSSFLERSPVWYIRVWLELGPENKRFCAGYGAIPVLACLVISLTLSFFFLELIPKSTRRLHDTLFKKLMSSTLEYSCGLDQDSLLNLFSQDIRVSLETLPLNLMLILYDSFHAIIVIGMATVGTRYGPTLSIVMMCCFYLMQKIYAPASKQILCLDQKAKDELRNHFIEAETGVRYIRSFGWEGLMAQRAFVAFDTSHTTVQNMQRLQRWLQSVIDLISTTLILVILLGGIYSGLPTANIGLSLVVLTPWSTISSEVVQSWIKFNNSLREISNLYHFMVTAPTESEPDPDCVQLPDMEQEHGQISLQDMSIQHRSGQGTTVTVLQNVSMNIPTGYKVGILGDAASGKSTFLQSFQNFLKFNGSITINGVPLSRIPRGVLRSKIITTVTQDVIEFDDTVRFNLCPWTMSISRDKGNVNDVACIELLKELGLWKVVAKHGGLDANLSELGLSHEEKRLVCSVARSCLHKLETGSRIVLVDEAMDDLDDDAAEKAARKVMSVAFDDCTVFTVSQRRESLKHCNVILKIEDGQVTTATQKPRPDVRPVPPTEPNFGQPPPDLESRPAMKELMAFITNGERLAREQIEAQRRNPQPKPRDVTLEEGVIKGVGSNYIFR